jgi:hypothetical protein
MGSIQKWRRDNWGTNLGNEIGADPKEQGLVGRDFSKLLSVAIIQLWIHVVTESESAKKKTEREGK